MLSVVELYVNVLVMCCLYGAVSLARVRGSALRNNPLRKAVAQDFGILTDLLFFFDFVSFIL